MHQAYRVAACSVRFYCDVEVFAVVVGRFTRNGAVFGVIQNAVGEQLTSRGVCRSVYDCGKIWGKSKLICGKKER